MPATYKELIKDILNSRVENPSATLALLLSTAPVMLVDGVTAPSTIAGIGQIYIDTADGDLKIKYGDGTVKTIVVDT